MITVISFIAMACSLLGNWLVNQKQRRGFVIWIISNVFWIVVNLLGDINVSQVIMFIAYAALNVQGWILWGKKTDGQTSQPEDPVPGQPVPGEPVPGEPVIDPTGQNQGFTDDDNSTAFVIVNPIWEQSHQSGTITINPQWINSVPDQGSVKNYNFPMDSDDWRIHS